MILFLLFVFLVVFISGADIGYTELLPLWRHFTYCFQHANLAHLFLNVVALFFVFRSVNPYIKPLFSFLVMYISAVLASFVAYYTIPVVGSSGMVYGGFGIILALMADKEIKVNKTFLIAIAVAVMSGFFFKHIAAGIHLASLVAGFVIIKTSRLIKPA